MTAIVTGLVKRRSELAGEAEAIRTRLAQIGTDLGHLDAVIRQFDPEHYIAAIRPKRSRSPDAAGGGEMSQVVLGVLQEATELLLTAEVTRRLAKAQGVDAAYRKARRLLGKRVGMTLKSPESAGDVNRPAGPGAMVLWNAIS